MPDWLIPVVVAAGGGTGLGALLNAIITARGSAFQQTMSLVEQLQQARKDDRELQAAYAAKVDVALEHLAIEREYSLALHAWALQGAPPPPPTRRELIPK
jgi:hypothetical protein